MHSFITTVCILGLFVCALTMGMLVISSLSMHDYHVVLTLFTLLMTGFFIATTQVING